GRSPAAVAVLSIAIPGMSYAAAIVPEVLAYPWYALCSWLIVRCLARRARLDYALAAGAPVVAGLIRGPQFSTVSAAFLIALAALWVTGPRGGVPPAIGRSPPTSARRSSVSASTPRSRRPSSRRSSRRSPRSGT